MVNDITNWRDAFIVHVVCMFETNEENTIILYVFSLSAIIVFLGIAYIEYSHSFRCYMFIDC